MLKRVVVFYGVMQCVEGYWLQCAAVWPSKLISAGLIAYQCAEAC